MHARKALLLDGNAPSNPQDFTKEHKQEAIELYEEIDKLEEQREINMIEELPPTPRLQINVDDQIELSSNINKSFEIPKIDLAINDQLVLTSTPIQLNTSIEVPKTPEYVPTMEPCFLTTHKFPQCLPGQEVYNSRINTLKQRDWNTFKQVLWNRLIKINEETNKKGHNIKFKSMSDWLKSKPQGVLEFLKENIDKFISRLYNVVCITERGYHYRFIMYPKDKEVIANEETDGLWYVKRFDKERTRIGPDGKVIYGVVFEGHEDEIRSTASSLVQTGRLKAAARRVLIHNEKKKAKLEGKVYKPIMKSKQRSVINLPRYHVTTNSRL